MVRVSARIWVQCFTWRTPPKQQVAVYKLFCSSPTNKGVRRTDVIKPATAQNVNKLDYMSTATWSHLQGGCFSKTRCFLSSRVALGCLNRVVLVSSVISVGGVVISTWSASTPYGAYGVSMERVYGQSMGCVHLICIHSCLDLDNTSKATSAPSTLRAPS